MPPTSTTNWSPLPPRTREAQFDEKWAFVAKKEKPCDPDDPADARKGDHWDHVALDPEHRLVVCVVPGKRTAENTGALVRDFHRRTSGHAPATRAEPCRRGCRHPAMGNAVLDRYDERPHHRNGTLPHAS